MSRMDMIEIEHLESEIEVLEATIAELQIQLQAAKIGSKNQGILLKQAVDEVVELQEENKWISVKERLPEYNTPCLVWMDEHKSAITCLWTGEDFSIVRANYTPHGVTHWKPITPPDSKPKLLDHNTSEDCWCEPEEVSDGVFVHKDRH